MSYPGNSALGDEVKQRILTTFGQSIELAGRGRRQEAMLGCDFILELDPQFSPAKTLKERLASGAEIGPATLDQDGDDPSAYDLFDYEALEIDAGFGSLGGGAADAEDPALGAELRALLAERELAQVLERARGEHEAIARNPELGEIVATAQARLEAQPYVESFLREAGVAIRGGDLERAGTALDKARSLDHDHPLLGELTRSWEEALTRIASPSVPGPAPPELPPRPPPPTPPTPPTPPPSPSGVRDDPGPAPFPELGAPALDMGDETLLAPSSPSPPAGRAPNASEARIAELLAEGQTAADQDDLQGAIDAWSRIFLIDVDHTEAARRIEDARRRKAEIEREVEEVFHEGLDALDQGERAAARVRFERVLEMQPNHLLAREYLQQLDAGGPVDASPAAADETAALSGLGSLSLGGTTATTAAKPAPGPHLQEEILVPVDPADLPAPGPPPSRRSTTAAAARPARRSFVLIGGAVLLLVLAAAWLVLENRDRWFPNSTAPEEEIAGAGETTPGLLERAIGLHESGQTAMAVGQLRRLPPTHPQYAEAQELIALWESSATPDEEVAATVSPEALARRAQLLVAAQTAFADRELLGARSLLARAAAIAPLTAEEEAQRVTIEQALAPIAQEIQLFEQGDYDFLLPRLWRLHDSDPGNRDIRRLLVDSYFNRGVRELQRGEAATASREFREALVLAPGDEELGRHARFAETYEARPRDLLYRIYVKYLPFRE